MGRLGTVRLGDHVQDVMAALGPPARVFSKGRHDGAGWGHAVPASEGRRCARSRTAVPRRPSRSDPASLTSPPPSLRPCASPPLAPDVLLNYLEQGFDVLTRSTRVAKFVLHTNVPGSVPPTCHSGPTHPPLTAPNAGTCTLADTESAISSSAPSKAGSQWRSPLRARSASPSMGTDPRPLHPTPTPTHPRAPTATWRIWLHAAPWHDCTWISLCQPVRRVCPVRAPATGGARGEEGGARLAAAATR